MAQQIINAHIIIENDESDKSGVEAYYTVELQWIPRIGETITLHSTLDEAEGDPFTHHLEVTKVNHKIVDIAQKQANDTRNLHFVEVKGRRTSQSRPV